MKLINKILDKRSLYPVYFLLLLLLLTYAMFMFYNPLHVGADTMFHYNRLHLVMETLREGSYPVYMDYNSLNGYGYLVNVFYPDFLLVPFAIIGNITSLHTGYVVLLFTCTLLTGLFTYISVNKVYKNTFAASLAAILFAFASYRLFDVFYRGAIGEYIAFTFIPIVFWGGYELIKGDYKKWYIFTIGFSLLIYTHVISSVIVFLVLLIYLCIYWKAMLLESKRILYLIVAGLVTLVLTSAYIVPMIEQMMSNSFFYTTNPSTNIFYSLTPINNIIFGLFNNIASQTEIAVEAKISGLLFCLLFLRIAIKSKTKQIKSVDYGVIIGLLFIFMASYNFPWKIFPFSKLAFIQHPSRLLMLTSFLFSIAGAYYISKIVKGRNRKLLSVIVLFMTTLLIMKSDANSNQMIFKNHSKLNNEILYGLTVGGAEYIPSATPSVDFLMNREISVKTSDNNTIISNFAKDKGHITFDAEVVTTDDLELPLTYYKGYKATLDGKQINYQQSQFGLIEIPVNKPGKVEIEYKGTILQKISWYITIVSIILFIIFVVVDRRKMKQRKQEKI